MPVASLKNFQVQTAFSRTNIDSIFDSFAQTFNVSYYVHIITYISE